MSKPLRIAVFVGQFPVVSETFILRQITGLIDLGHEVDLYADTRGDTAVLHAEVEKYRLLQRTTFMDMPEASAPWELPVWPLEGNTWVPGAAVAIANGQRFTDAQPALRRCRERAPALTEQSLNVDENGHRARSLSALYRLDRLVPRAGGYDVLHAHFGPVGDAFRFARELWQAPLVVSFHGYDFTTLPRLRGADMYHQLFAAVDTVTVNSEFTRGRVEALGCPSSKLQLLPVGLDLATFPFQARVREGDQPVRLITVARLVEIKGHEFVLRAVARVKAQHPAIRYDIVGDGPLREKLKVLVMELGLQDTVLWHGARDGVFVQQLMRNAHLAVLASVSINGDAEGQGLFLQEAQACGLPVVATHHGALPEGMLPGKSGFLVPERDVDALARQLDSLLAHPETWAEMGSCGRAFVEQRYGIHQLNERLVKLYLEATAAYRKVTPGGTS